MACLGEAMLIGSLVLVPMLFVQSLPDRVLYRALMLASVPTAPPAPPPPLLAKAIPRAATVPRKFNPDALVSPVVVPKVVAILNEAPPLGTEAIAGGIPGGIPGVTTGGSTGFFSSAVTVIAPPPPPPPAPVKVPEAAATKQITVGGDVEAALILVQVPPVYPTLARQGHIRGSVMLKAVIGTDGKIKNLSAISGHPLLVEAAMNAVRRWVYRPSVLDGIPVEVNTSIEVRFGLTSG